LPPLEMRRRSALDELRRCHRPHVLQADETLDLEIPVERALDCRRRSNTARYRLQKVEGHALRPAARAVVKRSRRLSCAPVNAKLTARNGRAVCILDCVRMATGGRMPTRRPPRDSASERFRRVGQGRGLRATGTCARRRKPALRPRRRRAEPIFAKVCLPCTRQRQIAG